MEDQTAETYSRAVSDLTLATKVTDLPGNSLSLNDGAERAVRTLLNVGRDSAKVMLVGNGGSAAIASHMQNDITKAVGVRAIVFTEPPLLTALANDDGYENVFGPTVELWGERGDLLIVISSSGQSENILRATRAARKRDCQVITLSGFGAENALRSMGDLNFHVSSYVYGYVEIAHATLTHFITDRARAIIGNESKTEVGI